MSEPAMSALMERSGEVSRLLHRLVQAMAPQEPELATRI